MSNALAPAFAGIRPPQVFHEAESDSLADGIGSSYAVIGYKGSKWTLRHRGDRHLFVRPDDGSPIGYIDVIIVRAAKVKAKSYYDGFDNEASEGKRPICASMDGVHPDRDVQQKQSETCALCPRNVWKTLPDGRKTRECTDYKRLAVLLLPAVTKQLLGAPLMEPAFLRVPPASLNDLATFGDRMEGQGWSYWKYVTRISFDPLVSYPKFQFNAVTPLTEAEGPVVMPIRNSVLAKRITGEEGFQPAALNAPALPVGNGGGGVFGGVLTGNHQAPVEPEIIPPSPPAGAQIGLPTGNASGGLFAGVDVNADPAQPAMTPVTTADTGEPTLADQAIDDEIAALLNKPLLKQ